MVIALHAQPLVLPLQTGDLRRVVRRRQRRLRCGAPRRRRRLSPGPTQLHPAARNRIAQAKFLGHRAGRAAARSHQIDRLPFVVVRKRPTLTSFHSTPPGSSSLLQVSINSEEVHPSPPPAPPPSAPRPATAAAALSLRPTARAAGR